MERKGRPIEDQVAQILFRGAVYQALALGFAYPSGAMLSQLKSRWSGLLRAPLDWPDGVQHPFEQATARLETCDGEALEHDYVRLFGPAGGCPLHETSYGDAGRLLGKAPQLADISGFYLAFAVQPAPRDTHLEDHITLELEFMSILSLKEASALAEGWQEPLEITRRAQRQFVQDHLGTWTSAMTERLARCEPHPFYLALGETVQCLVRAEVTRLEASPAPISGWLADKEMAGETFQCPHAADADEAGSGHGR